MPNQTVQEILFDFWNELDSRLDESSLDEFHAGKIQREVAAKYAKKIESHSDQQLQDFSDEVKKEVKSYFPKEKKVEPNVSLDLHSIIDASVDSALEKRKA